MGHRGPAETPPSREKLFRLMRDAPENCRSLSAAYRRWHDPRVVVSAIAATQNRAVEDVDGPPVQLVGRVWIDGDTRIRSECGSSIGVVNGGQWYAQSPGQFVRSAVDDGELGIERLDDARFPFVFIPDLEFDYVSRGEVVGRRCWLVHGRRREGDRGRSHPRVAAGDEWRFAIDSATGIALRIESYWRGVPSTLMEITELEIAPAFAESLFQIEERP